MDIKNKTKTVGVLFAAIGIVILVSASVRADELNNVEYYKYSGQAVFEAGEYDQAAEYFRKAYELESDWRILYDIARCEAKAKRHGVALATYKEYMALGGGNFDPKHAGEVKAEIQRLQYEVGYLEIKVPGHLVVMVDGIKRGRGSHLENVPVTAGIEHEVTTKKTAPRKVVVEFGRTKTVNLEETPNEAPVEQIEEESKASKESQDRKNTSKPRAGFETVGWVLFATGAAELLGSAITGALAKKKEDELFISTTLRITVISV